MPPPYYPTKEIEPLRPRKGGKVRPADQRADDPLATGSFLNMLDTPTKERVVLTRWILLVDSTIRVVLVPLPSSENPCAFGTGMT